MRPIDADALVADLNNMAEEWIAMEKHVPTEFKQYYRGKFEAVMDIMVQVNRHMPTLDLAPKWISVKDRLPPHQGEKVLVINGHGNVRIYALWKREYGNKWTWVDENGKFNHVNDITHWMPLPEPPKEES